MLTASAAIIVGADAASAAPRRSALADVRAAQVIVAREAAMPTRCGRRLQRNCSTVVAVVGIPGSGRMETIRFRWGQWSFTAGRYAFERVGAAKGLNTHYRVQVCARGRCAARGHAILAWKVPIRRHGGGWADVVYTPYSAVLHRPEVVRAGDQYLGVVIHRARELLRRHGVYSRVDPKRYASVVIPSMTTEAIVLVEKIDHAEFARCAGHPRCVRGLVERVLVALAVNRDRAYRYAVSHAGAAGFMQFMPGTWAMVRSKYPSARLSSFRRGSRDHIESVMAAIVLNDYNLTFLAAAHVGALRRSSEALTLYSAAAYNGNPKWAVNAIAECGRQWMDPRRCRWLRPETTVYLRKVRAVWPIVRS